MHRKALTWLLLVSCGMVVVGLVVLRQPRIARKLSTLARQAATITTLTLQQRGLDTFLPFITNRTPPVVPFHTLVIDQQTAGDVKLVGDLDGDHFPDLVIGGAITEQLNWYHYPDWDKTIIATPNNEFTTDGALGDVDHDGDLDIVVPDGDAGDNLVWFENPRPQGDPFQGEEWRRHVIGAINGWGKDVKLADYDEDGRLDVATRNAGELMIFFQSGAAVWQRVAFHNLDVGNEGMAQGDIDGDNQVDLVLHGVWLHNPGGPAAQEPSAWQEYPIGEADNDFKALVVDLNQDGQQDVLFSSSEGTADVNWWTPITGDPTGAWQQQTVVPLLNRCHTLQAADMDLDGDLDLVLGQMHTGDTTELMILLNLDGQATRWQKQLIDLGGVHNGVVADIGNDGDYDLYGANWTGNPPVHLWENALDEYSALDRWRYQQVTNQHAQTFGLAFSDVDRDGQTDIASGPYWYRNPGNTVDKWLQRAFPAGMQVSLALDVDKDRLTDLIAQKAEEELALYWLEATNQAGTTWQTTKIGTVPRASHELGAQGYQVASLQPGARPVVLIASGNGIYYFMIPPNPTAGNWPRVHINANPADEGFAVGDVDHDGLADLAATTGDSKRVEWYQNPGDGSGDWPAFPIGAFADALYPDRTALADLNGDGRLDIVVTEENGEATDAQSYWWEQPTAATAAAWPAHLITTQGTTNSLAVADMDFDGDVDLLLAEHRGSQKLAIWANDGCGHFAEHTIDAGKESHLGARPVDIDGDGDLDIVSIAWDAPRTIHLWWNELPKLKQAAAKQRQQSVTCPQNGQ